ncbi:Triphosphate tunnel metalloenzyme 3 [Linum perenne]
MLRRKPTKIESQSTTKTNSKKPAVPPPPSSPPLPQPPLPPPPLPSPTYSTALNLPQNPNVSASPLESQKLEIEVKLSLPNTESHARFKTLISQSHLKTVNQRNLFFDTTTSGLSSKRAVLRL